MRFIGIHNNINTLARLLVKNWPANLLVPFMLVMFSFTLGPKIWNTNRAIDFYQFWVVGQAVKKLQITDIYSIEERTRVAEYFFNEAKRKYRSRFFVANRWRPFHLTATPFLYALFYAFSSGQYISDYIRFNELSLSIYFLAIYVLCRLFRIDVLIASFVLIFFSRYFWPFDLDIRFGNVTQVQLGSIALFLLLQHISRSGAGFLVSGFLLGLGLAFKPTLLPTVVLLGLGWTIMGRYKKLFYAGMGMLASFIFAFIFSYALLGNECTWWGWHKNFESIGLIPLYVKDSFPSIVLNKISIVHHSLLGFFLVVLSAGTLIAGRWRGRTGNANAKLPINQENLHEDTVLASMGGLIYLLSSPMVHGQYFMFIIPVVLFLLRPKGEGWKKAPISTSISSGLAMGALLILLGNPMKSWHYTITTDSKIWNFSAVWILLALLIWEMFNMHRHIAFWGPNENVVLGKLREWIFADKKSAKGLSPYR